MTIIGCSGDGRARGCAHGEGARQLVRESLSRWEEATLSSRTGGGDILDYSRGFLAGTGLIEAMEAITPDLLAEVRGIAEGANVSPELAVAYNLMDQGELPGAARLSGRLARLGRDVRRCDPSCSRIPPHPSASARPQSDPAGPSVPSCSG